MKLFFSLASRYKYIVLIAVIVLFFAIPILKPGLYDSHDGVPQIVRIGAYVKALSDGQFPVRWAADLNYRYGNPAFIFFYSLSGYTAAFLYFLGFNLQDSYKLLMVASLILAPIFFYFWAELIFKKKSIAFVSALFYALAPYSFLDAFVRGHLGESLALVIIPLIFYWVEKNNIKISVINIILGGLAYTLLILAHSILAVIFSATILGYIVFKNYNNRKLLFANLTVIAIGLGTSAYFWMPIILEGKYIISRLIVGEWYKGHFIKFPDMIYSQWGFGSYINKPGGLSAQIGPFHVFFATLSSILLFKKINSKIQVVFWLVMLLVGVFMSVSFSEFLWQRSHLLAQFQFPWRFTALASFAASVLVGYFLMNLKSKKILAVAVFGIIILSFQMNKVSGYINKSDSYYFDYPGTAAYHNEATTIWVAGDAYEFPKKPVEIISGKGDISNYDRKSNVRTYFIVAETDIRVLDNTVYFPGWRAEVDGRRTPIEFQDMNHRGLITFGVPKGNHKISVMFGESPIRFFADIITIVVLILITLVFIFRKKAEFLLNRL